MHLIVSRQDQPPENKIEGAGTARMEIPLEKLAKILLVHNTYQQPGGEDVVFEQEGAMLRRRGHRVVTFCRSNGDTDNYRGFGRLALAKQSIWSSTSRRDFVQFVQREKPDVVHVHNTFVMISPSIYSACREMGIPLVQSLHNYRLLCPAATFFRDGRICEECLNGSLIPSVRHACYHNSYSASAVVATMLSFHRFRHTWNDISIFIALSEFSRQKFISGGLPEEKILVKPNFVYPDPGVGTSERNYALFVGRLSPEKRVSTVLRACHSSSRSIPVVVIGGGPDLPRLQAQAEELKLDNVEFRGHLPREETVAAIRGARFLVFSSEWYENFPVTIAESFACATPVLASRMGAMKELISDGRTGLHFTPGDSDDLAQKIDWAWTHPDEMRTIGIACRAEYESKYTAETNYPLLTEIYSRAMQSKR